MNQKHTITTIAKRVSQLSEKETEAFFQAFLTPQELETLQGRVALIEQLLEGQSQREIADTLGISFSQITRGSRELKYGTGKKFFPLFFKK